MSEHRVLAHLGLAASDYDAAIRRYIPEYERMIQNVVDLVAALPAREPYVIDLGAGTGALGCAILDAIPTARVQFLDIDPAMLEVAGARAARHGSRAELVRGSFDDALPPCDAVVASLALHHVPELERKRALYERIHEALRPGGALIIADATVHESGRERARIFDVWAGWMAEHGIARPEADALFAKWAGEDQYYPLMVELDLLGSAGFGDADCFWKYGPSTVYGGFR
jgi:tRNA (cmo5U34)-methyltransferase